VGQQDELDDWVEDPRPEHGDREALFSGDPQIQVCTMSLSRRMLESIIIEVEEEGFIAFYQDS
jgi:hypothetical protein